MLELSDDIQKTCTELEEVYRLSRVLAEEQRKIQDRKTALVKALDQQVDVFVRAALAERDLAVCSQYFSTGTHIGIGQWNIRLEQSGVFPKPQMRLSYVNVHFPDRHIEHLELLCSTCFRSFGREVLEREGRLINAYDGRDITDVPMKQQGVLGRWFYKSISGFLSLPKLPLSRPPL